MPRDLSSLGDLCDLDALNTAAALDALYDFERWAEEGVKADDTGTRIGLVRARMDALERAVGLCLAMDKRALDAGERRALHDLLRGHDAARAGIERACARLGAPAVVVGGDDDEDGREGVAS